MMTKKHYELVASRVARRLGSVQAQLNPASDACIITEAVLKNLARDLADDFAAEDRTFDRVRFLVGCGLTHREINMPREI